MCLHWLVNLKVYQLHFGVLPSLWAGWFPQLVHSPSSTWRHAGKRGSHIELRMRYLPRGTEVWLSRGVAETTCCHVLRGVGGSHVVVRPHLSFIMAVMLRRISLLLRPSYRFFSTDPSKLLLDISLYFFL